MYSNMRLKQITLSTPVNSSFTVEMKDGESFRVNAKQVLTVRSVTDGLEVTLSENRIYYTRTLTVSPSRFSNIRLSAGSSPPRLYAGRLSIRKEEGVLKVVLYARLEEILNQILVSEISDISRKRALKALSIIIRNYLYFHLGRHKEGSFDFCDTTHCQAFKGWNTNSAESADKIREEVLRLLSGSRGVVMIHEGKIIEGYYTACCGGHTSTPEFIWGGETVFPYRQTDSPFCRKSPYHRWERAVDKETFAKLFGLDADTLQVKTSKPSNPGGYLNSITWNDSNKSEKMSITRFRTKVGKNIGWNRVLSHSFTVRLTEKEIIFNGRGFGHGIGLCMHSSLEMDRLGYSWKNILDFFYPSVKLVKIKNLLD